MADSIGESRYQPGDVVEHLKTETEYVIQAVEAVGVGFLIFGITLFGAENLEQFVFIPGREDSLDLIKRNVTNKTPQEVRTALKNKVEGALEANNSLLSSLAKKDATALRHLLMFANEVDEGKFSKEVVDIAKAMIQYEGRTYTKEQIYQVWRKILPVEEFPDEVLLRLATKLSGAITRASTLNGLKTNQVFATATSLGETSAKVADTLYRGLSGASSEDLRFRRLLAMNAKRPRTQAVQYGLSEVMGSGLGISGQSFLRENKVFQSLAAAPTYAEKAAILIKAAESRNKRDFGVAQSNIFTARLVKELEALKDVGIRAKTPVINTFLDFVLDGALPYAFHNYSTSVKTGGSRYGNARQRIRKTSSSKQKRPYQSSTTESLGFYESVAGNAATDSIIGIRKSSFINDIIKDDWRRATFTKEGVKYSGGEAIQTFLKEIDGAEINFRPEVLSSFLRKVSGRNPINLTRILKEHKLHQSLVSPLDVRGSGPLTIYNSTTPQADLDGLGILSSHFKGAREYSYRDAKGFIKSAATISDIPSSTPINRVRVNDTPLDKLIRINIGKQASVGELQNAVTQMKKTQPIYAPSSPFRVDTSTTLKHLNSAEFHLGLWDGANMNLGWVKGPDGNPKLMGSTSATSMRRQISLIRKYLDDDSGKIGILDLETNFVHDGAVADPAFVRIRELALGAREGGEFKPILRIGTKEAAKMSQADIIIKAADALGGLDGVGSHTSVDINWLIMVGQREIAQATDPSVKLALTEALKTLDNVKTKKHFDTMLLFQMGGESLGNLSLAELAVKNGETSPHAHSAWPDVVMTDKLARSEKYEKGIRSRIRGAKITPGEDLFYVHNQNDSYFNSTFKLLGIEKKFDTANQMDRFLIHAQLVDLNGESPLYGGVHTMEKNSISQVSTFLGTSTTKVTNKNIGTLREMARVASDDMFSRRTRALNPFSQSYFDDLGHLSVDFDHRVDGPLIANDLIAYQAVMKQEDKIKALQFGIQEVADKKMADDVDALVRKGVMDIHSQIVKGKTFTPQQSSRIEALLRVAVSDPSYSRNLRESGFGRLIESEIGQDLLNSYSRGDTSFTIRTLALDHLRTEQTGILGEIVKNDPRVSFSIGSETAKVNMTLDGVKGFKAKVDDLTSSFILNLHKEENRNILTEIFAQSDPSLSGNALESKISRLAALSEEFKRKYNTPSNLTGYEIAKSGPHLAHLDYSDPMFGELSQARSMVVKSKQVRTALSDGFKDFLATKSEDETRKGLQNHFLKLVKNYRKTGDIAKLGTELMISASNMEGFEEFFRTERLHLSDSKFIDWLEGNIDQYKDRVSRYSSILNDSRFSTEGVYGLTEYAISRNDFHYKVLKEASKDVDYAELQKRVKQDVDRYINSKELELQQLGGGLSPEVEALARGGNAVAGNQTRVNLVEQFQRLGNEAQAKRPPAAGRSTLGAAAQAGNEATIRKILASKASPSNPLFVGAAIAASLAAFSPQGDEDTGGMYVKQAPNPHDIMTRTSEQPGTNPANVMFTTGQQPFTLDITFQGYLAEKGMHDELVQQVFNSINGTVEFKTVNNSIKDKRVQDYRRTANDLIRTL